MENYFESENELTRKLFDLDIILDFQLRYGVQVIRGDDYMYLCYINHEVCGIGLTPMYSLVAGIKFYKENIEK